MIYSKLLDGVNNNWSAKAKTRYLYWNFCKNIVYDERFPFTASKEVAESIYYREPNIDEDEETTFVCNPAAKAFVEMLTRAGVKAKIIRKPPLVKRAIDVPDVAVMFYDEDGTSYFINPTADIENCRYGLKTAFFGITKHLYDEARDCKEIPEDEIEALDREVGNINEYGYSDIVFKLLKEEVKNTNNFKNFLVSVGVDPTNMTDEEILQNKMMYLTRLMKFNDGTASTNERKQFYKKLFRGAVLDRLEGKKFNAYEFVREEAPGQIESKSILEINLSSSPIYYVYDESEKGYMAVEGDELVQSLNDYKEVKGKVPIIVSRTLNAKKRIEEAKNPGTLQESKEVRQKSK